MDDVVVFEAAHHLHEGIDLANGGEELVAEPCAFTGSLHKPGDINEFDGGWNQFLRS